MQPRGGRRPPPPRYVTNAPSHVRTVLQAHGALPPRPPVDPATTSAIDVLEASARYAEGQVDARSRDAAVDAALGACARALSRGEVPLVAPAAAAAARVAQLASGAPNALPRLAQLVDQLVGWALDATMDRRDAKALTDDLARFGANCWRSERVVASTLIRNLDQDLGGLAAACRDEASVVRVATVARCLSAVLRNVERDAAHAQCCARFVDALISARPAASEPHAWDDVCHELCVDLLRGSDFGAITLVYGRCVAQQLNACETHARDARDEASAKVQAKHARRCARAVIRVAAWLGVNGPLAHGGAFDVLQACLDNTNGLPDVARSFRGARRALGIVGDATKEPGTTLHDARTKLTKTLAALATLARAPERVAAAAAQASDREDYAFFLDAALRDVDGAARLASAAPRTDDVDLARSLWRAWCATAVAVARGAAQPARSRGAGAAARREALERALQALCGAPGFGTHCFDALIALCGALPAGTGVRLPEARAALGAVLPVLVARLQLRPVANADLSKAGAAFGAIAQRLASGDDCHVDAAARASLSIVASLGGGGDGSVTCIRGLGRPKAEHDRDAALSLVSTAAESAAGDLGALFVEDAADVIPPVEIAVIDLDTNATPALKTRHEREGDARACLLALLRPATRSIANVPTPQKGKASRPALLLRRPGTPTQLDESDEEDSAAHRARAAAPAAFAQTASAHIVASLLRSCLGNPAQTLERVRTDVQAAAAKGDRSQRVNVVSLVDALEREMGRVAEARPSTLPDDVQQLLGHDDEADDSDGDHDTEKPAWEVAAFFRQNRKVCDGWLASVRFDAARCALQAGLFAQASYHAQHACAAEAQVLREVQGRKHAAQKKTGRAEMDACRRFEDALSMLALARTALGDGAGVRGLQAWHRDVADASDGKKRGWWLEAAADVRCSASPALTNRA